MTPDYLEEVFMLDFNGISYPFYPGTLSKRDLTSQLPPQVYPDIWSGFFSPGDVVLDVGSYVGITAIQLAILGGVVHCFEGSPRNVPRLKKACSRLRQIVIHDVALHELDSKCRVRFNDCIDREHPMQEVEYVVYDTYASKNNIPDPKFVKMDIEGMETVALKGMTRLLEIVRPIWQIECHKDLPFAYDGYPGHLTPEQGGFSFTKFEELDYIVFDCHMQTCKTSDMENLKQYFFVPSERLVKFL